MYLFVYGSLTNEKSRKKSLRYSFLVRENVMLVGYTRKINAPYKDGYLYMNIVAKRGAKVQGSILQIDERDKEKLARREEGYSLVNITKILSQNFESDVFAYMQPDRFYPNIQIPQSYIDTCLYYVPEAYRDKWLRETVIENDILDDRDNPVYEYPG